MIDSIGKLPKIVSPEQALKEILKIASDKREHILSQDQSAWLQLKLKACGTLARRGLNNSTSKEDLSK
jgi:uncharacterized protein YecT (DUF1311 family)